MTENRSRNIKRRRANLSESALSNLSIQVIRGTATSTKTNHRSSWHCCACSLHIGTFIVFCFVVASPTFLPNTPSGSYIRVLDFSTLLGLSTFPRGISIPRPDQTSRAFATFSPHPPWDSNVFHFPASFPTSSILRSCSSLPRFVPATSTWLRRQFSEVSLSRRVLGSLPILPKPRYIRVSILTSFNRSISTILLFLLFLLLYSFVWHQCSRFFLFVKKREERKFFLFPSSISGISYPLLMKTLSSLEIQKARILSKEALIERQISFCFEFGDTKWR